MNSSPPHLSLPSGARPGGRATDPAVELDRGWEVDGFQRHQGGREVTLQVTGAAQLSDQHGQPGCRQRGLVRPRVLTAGTPKLPHRGELSPTGPAGASTSGEWCGWELLGDPGTAGLGRGCRDGEVRTDRLTFPGRFCRAWCVPHSPLENNRPMSSIRLCKITLAFPSKYVQLVKRNTSRKVSAVALPTLDVDVGSPALLHLA